MEEVVWAAGNSADREAVLQPAEEQDARDKHQSCRDIEEGGAGFCRGADLKDRIIKWQKRVGDKIDLRDI